ncbi:MAG: hypothetical protein ACK5PF_08240 [bacterium]
MFVLKSTHEGRIRALEIQLDRATDRINTLQADNARLLHHLGLRKIDTPATPAGVKLVAADSPEAKAADAPYAALQEANMRMQNAYQRPVGPIVQVGNPPWERF